MRIDILTWGSVDYRKLKRKKKLKKQYSPDETLAIMYYFLLREIVRKNKGKMNHELYADKAAQIKKHWKTLQYILAHEWKELSEEIEKAFSVPKEDSKDHVFIQLADIMAGFMRHTFTYHAEYASFKKEKRYTNKTCEEKDYKHHLCWKIEQWLKNRAISVAPFRDGGLANLPWDRDQPVNLWKFKEKEEKPEKEDKKEDTKERDLPKSDTKRRRKKDITLFLSDEFAFPDLPWDSRESSGEELSTG